MAQSTNGPIMSNGGDMPFSREMGTVKPSEEQIQRDVQIVFENMGLPEKQDTKLMVTSSAVQLSRPESRTVTFSDQTTTSSA